MKLNMIFTLIGLLALGFYNGSVFSDDHKHEESKKTDDHKDHDKHEGKHEEDEKHDEHDEGEESHAHGDSSGHEEESEAPKNVGPNKGIVSFDEHEGFVLSKEAFQNFKIEYTTLQGTSPWNVPKATLVLTRDDVSVFRYRNGKLLRVDVKVTSKNHTKNHSDSQIASKDLVAGDQVVVKGVAFLRVAELDVTSGESGHHH